MKMRCHFDGGCEPNPGRMGWGWTIEAESFCDGGVHGTNNEAEYRALIALLRMLAARGIRSADIRGDSELVVNQVNGEYQCKAYNLQQYCATAVNLLQAGGHSIQWCLRDQNTLADSASRAALAGHLSPSEPLSAETLLASAQKDLSLYTKRLGDLAASLSSVKIGKALKAAGMRDDDGNPVGEAGIRIFHHGFWTNFWHIENCRKIISESK
jgi:ribonuclease HI